MTMPSIFFSRHAAISATAPPSLWPQTMIFRSSTSLRCESHFTAAITSSA